MKYFWHNLDLFVVDETAAGLASFRQILAVVSKQGKFWNVSHWADQKRSAATTTKFPASTSEDEVKACVETFMRLMS